jgi:putative phosphoesterase
MTESLECDFPIHRSDTKIGILSDVHGDYESLVNALKRIEELGCGTVLCCGDLVGYGDKPERVVREIRSRNVLCVRGNHDRWATERPLPGLSAESVEYLKSLPQTLSYKNGDTRILLCHGTPASDMIDIAPYAHVTDVSEIRQWLAAANADILIAGHFHQPFKIKMLGSGTVLNPGSAVAKNMGIESSATFGVLNLPDGRFSLYSTHDGNQVECPTFRTGVRDRRQNK